MSGPQHIMDLTDPSDENFAMIAQILVMLGEVRNYGIELFRFHGHGCCLILTDPAQALKVQEALHALGILELIPPKANPEAN